MDELNWLVLQLFQPYFYYPLVLSLALFIAVNVAVRFTRIKDHRLRSYLFGLPMLSPLVIYALYPPQLDILVMEKGSPAFTFPPNPMSFMHLHPAPPILDNLFSVTGSLCISGILLGVSLLTLCLVLNRFGTKRGFIPLSEEDYPRALSIVAKRCKRFGIEQPQIGLVEDLRPNAFVGGHGRSTVLVFSLGMLETFDEEELTVAIDHELMHLKNRDTLFRSASIGLIALSFFNPIAYLSYTAALREREHLADDGSTRSKRSREALKSALRKAAEMTSQVEGMASVSSLRWMGMVPLFPRNMLATHPAEEKRLESISRSNRERKASTRTICLTMLFVVMISAVLLTMFVDTRNLLVQSSPREMMMFGANGPKVIDHALLANAGLMPHEGFSHNITFLPPPWLQNETDFPATTFLNSSIGLVATITTSN
ncbi:MAG: M48 family metalloprotease [Methanomassiliicoccales archaeon]|jgi:Zn-dependent protease with chaperone function